jgi:transposase
VDEWLPQRHLARFVVEVVDKLDLSELEKSYRGSGSASYHPAMLLSLLIYGYATRVFSSRALERATYDSVAFRFIAGNDHPDHDTIANFRKRFISHIEPLFLEVLKLARALGMLKLGTVVLDGTKVHANASRHSVLSYGHGPTIDCIRQHLHRYWRTRKNLPARHWLRSDRRCCRGYRRQLQPFAWVATSHIVSMSNEPANS